MKVLLLLFMLVSCFYTCTYGVNLITKHNNKLGGIAILALAVLGTFIPGFVLFSR
ncbi:hypothetical protein JHL18_11505 [Clostridium sp. YIM B02505]|uniref:Uncharacterized protein n=1 Tax=Clostridium yunnanense TaxID=2800325 RepID=A0ABS1EPD4_9CLOT|nr:hypothetical protein [Clostridium yunnanense]MBK1811251.1 hypothetical protein [Clostridium yunnanense]